MGRCFLFVFGAGDESRTRDLNLGKVALYQLSYSRLGSYYCCPAIAVPLFAVPALMCRPAWFRVAVHQRQRLYMFFRVSAQQTGKSGAGDESRTRDLNLGKVALYQLSYSRIFLPFFCKRREYNDFLENCTRQEIEVGFLPAVIGVPTRDAGSRAIQGWKAWGRKYSMRREYDARAVRCRRRGNEKRALTGPFHDSQYCYYECKSGAGDESRTRDLNLGKVALYQLSYSRIWFRKLHRTAFLIHSDQLGYRSEGAQSSMIF